MRKTVLWYWLFSPIVAFSNLQPQGVMGVGRGSFGSKLWGLIALLALSTTASTAEKPHWLDAYKGQEELFSIDGYRLIRYRAPTPLHAPYATTLNTTELQQLRHSRNVSLIDVQPIPWKAGKFIEKAPRQHIPGSFWLPNVGQGELADSWRDYFNRQLVAITQGNKQHPLVFYCRADCWMSWNAVKRAYEELGYQKLYWYRDGVDGWSDAELPMENASPIPYP